MRREVELIGGPRDGEKFPAEENATYIRIPRNTNNDFVDPRKIHEVYETFVYSYAIRGSKAYFCGH